MQKRTRLTISLIVLILSIPAIGAFLLSLPFILELAVDFFKDSQLLGSFLYIMLCSGILAWVFLLYLTKYWLQNIKLGPHKPLIATFLICIYLYLICFGKFESIFYLFLICSPSILFAIYLVWWHSTKNIDLNIKKAP